MQRSALARAKLAAPVLDGPLAILTSVLRPVDPERPFAAVLHRRDDAARARIIGCGVFERALRSAGRSNGALRPGALIAVAAGNACPVPICSLCGSPPPPTLPLTSWVQSHLLAGPRAALSAPSAQPGG